MYGSFGDSISMLVSHVVNQDVLVCSQSHIDQSRCMMVNVGLCREQIMQNPLAKMQSYYLIMIWVF